MIQIQLNRQKISKGVFKKPTVAKKEISGKIETLLAYVTKSQMWSCHIQVWFSLLLEAEYSYLAFNLIHCLIQWTNQ